MLVGVCRVHGQHAPKPAVAGQRIVNENVKVTARDGDCAGANEETRVSNTQSCPTSKQLNLSPQYR